MKRTKTILLCMLATVVALTSCVKESVNFSTSEGEETEVTIMATVPGTAENTSRALSDADEIKITDIKVLVFESGSLKYAVKNATWDTPTATTNGGSSQFPIRFTTLVTAVNQNFVVIVNGASRISAASPAIAVGQTKTDIQNKLIDAALTATNGTGWWDSSAGKTIPMSGEVSSAVTANITISSALNLVRTMARINITVGSLPSGKSFTFESVGLYNTSRNGYLMNVATPNTAWRWERSATTPTVNDHYIYGSTHVTNSGRTMDNVIYTFPYIARDNTVPTTLVVKGILVDGSTTHPSSFYKIEMMDGASARAITRNSSYNVTISDVKGAGYPTEPEVFTSTTVTMNATITQWSPVGISTDLEGPL